MRIWTTMIFGEFQRTEERGFARGLIGLSESGALTHCLPADTIRHWQDGRATLVQHTLWNSEESKSDRGPLHDPESQQTLCAWARIDNRDDLAPHLGLSASDVRIPDIRFIEAAYRKWGEDCVHHLLGDFAFVIWDARRCTLFCARDPMGVRPFYYHLSERRCLFATSLAVFAGLSGFQLEPVPSWMAEYQLQLSMSFESTAYRGILKLPPGHCLTVGPESHALRAYHRLDGETVLRLKRSEEYVEVYREELERAIHRRLRSAYPLGAELSGGIDSSTLAAYAARFLPDPGRRLHAFAFATQEQEREYIDEVLRAHPFAGAHVFDTYGVAAEEKPAHVSRSLRILGYPMEHENSTGHEPFYRKAEALGVRTLLSGFGGDEFVTNPATVALDELLHRGKYLELYRRMPGNPLTQALRVAKRVLTARRRPQVNPRFASSLGKRWDLHTLKRQYVEAFDLERRFLANARFDAGWKTLNDFVLQNRWAPFVPTRLENCTLMAAARGIEYRWPLLDVRLVQLFLSIPAEQKIGKGMTRLLHRRAIDGVVPAKVTWKQGKDMGSALEPMTCRNNVFPRTEALHPLLAEMVDPAKCAPITGDQAQDSPMGLMRSRNLDRVTWLDAWLREIVDAQAENSPGETRAGALARA